MRATGDTPLPCYEDVHVTTETVTVRVPPKADHLALLRTAVGWVAGRDEFTIDQVDDLKMAVEEAAVQLLRHGRDSHITLDLFPTASGVEARLRARVVSADPVIDEASFSWLILKALADDVEVDADDDVATIVLRKTRLDLLAGGAVAGDAE